MYNEVKNDCRSTTGYNLRRLVLRFNASDYNEIGADVLKKAVYKDIPTGGHWKIYAAKDLIEAKHDSSILPNFTVDELKELLDDLTTS